MDVIPKIVAGVFLFRTLKNPIFRIIQNIEGSSSPLLVLSFFLLGELGLAGIFKLLPLFLYLHLQYHLPVPITIKKFNALDVMNYIKQLRDLDHFTLVLTPIISSTAFLTGWFVKNPQAVNSLPINFIFSHLLNNLLWFILIFTGIIYSIKFTNKIVLLAQMIYLSLFFSIDHLSFLFLFVFVIIGLLTKHDINRSPFLSFFMIEACLTVGTLFTSAPTNILFAIGSIALVWKLSKLSDVSKISQHSYIPISSDHLSQEDTSSDLINGLY